MSENNRYVCQNVKMPLMPKAGDPVWEMAAQAYLSDVESGQTPFLLTEFRLLRDDAQRALFVRFKGQDDEVVSTFRRHDECLYEQDVFELFIADGEGLTAYKEIEVSPYDRHFTARVSFKSPDDFSLDMGWDIPGFITHADLKREQNLTFSLWRLPYDAFEKAPLPGTSFRFNAFRIDHSIRGRSLQAWQHTGIPNFHVPERFGFLDFTE